MSFVKRWAKVPVGSTLNLQMSTTSENVVAVGWYDWGPDWDEFVTEDLLQGLELEIDIVADYITTIDFQFHGSETAKISFDAWILKPDGQTVHGTPYATEIEGKDGVVKSVYLDFWSK